MAGRNLIFTQIDESQWTSVDWIRTSFERAFLRLGRGSCVVTLDDKNPTDVGLKVALVKTKKPDAVVAIDYRPPFSTLIRLGYDRDPIPPMIIFVYGAFLGRSPPWVTAERALRGRRVLFVTPSERHSERWRKVLKSPERAVVTVPFAYDDSFFTPGAKRSRTQFRAVYAGRISLQKNVPLLIQTFLKATEGTDATLTLAGDCDDIGMPLLGLQPLRFAGFVAFQSFLSSLSTKDRKRIVYRSQLSKTKLRALYRNSDLFVSLAVHHDEDFGLAPLEAIGCGCRALLTDWGGFAELAQHLPRDIDLVPTRMKAKGVVLDIENFQNLLKRAMRKKRTSSGQASGMLGQSALAVRLSKLPKSVPVFNGFTNQFLQTARRIVRDNVTYSNLKDYRASYLPYAGRGSKRGSIAVLEVWEAEFQKLRAFAPKMTKLSAVHEKAWPASLAYLSPIRTVFLSDLKTLRDLRTEDRWIVRDSATAINKILGRAGPPPDFRGRLLVHLSVLSKVPLAWRAHVSGFSVESRTALRKKSKCLILNHGARPTTDRRTNAYYFGGPAGVAEWSTLLRKTDLSDYEFIEIGATCADSLVRHLCLSRGATPSESAPGGDFESFPLSEKHELRVYL